MGNHEYCSGCGASDFHSGMSCEEAYPKRWAIKEAERKAKQAVVDAETARVNKLVKVVVMGGKRSIVARLLALDAEDKRLREKREALKAKANKLYNETSALRKHCPHPPKYVNGGFMYTTCNLCGWSD